MSAPRPSGPVRVVDLPAVPDVSGLEHELVGVSPAIRRVRELVVRYARTELPVLIVGATGTGKEVVARALHRLSGRSTELVDVNCGALPATMLEALLFGHARGAFTGAAEARPGLIEQAQDGTLFLDELSSLPLANQPALLRVLETGELRRLGETRKRPVRFRVVAAVQDELSAQIAQGQLRRDLYHRLARAVITLPPLAARREDVAPLAEHFARRLHRRLAAGAAAVLTRHAWPGNVRELLTVIERAAATTDDPVLGAADLTDAMAAGVVLDHPASDPLHHPIAMAGGERAALAALCAAHDYRVEAIAAELGVHRVTLFRRLRRLGLSLRALQRARATPMHGHHMARGHRPAMPPVAGGDPRRSHLLLGE